MSLPTRTRAVLARVILLCLAVAAIAPAVAQETITYTYDARGRLVTVDHGPIGPNAGVNANYTYDPADNRSQVVVNTGTATLTLAPTSLPNGTVGVSYSQTITASGGTGAGYGYAVTSGILPAGLSLNSSTGLLSGTPTASGTSSFTVKATDGGGNNVSRSYTVTVSAATLSLSPTSLPSGTWGTAYSQTISASGGSGAGYSYSISVGSLPAGLSLAGTTGVLSGTPSASGTFSFTVRAADSYGNSGSQAYSVTISPATLSLSPTSLPSGTWQTGYSQTVAASGGSGTGYSYNISSGSVPTGLSFGSTGVLSGTPSTNGTSNFTVIATDSAGNAGTRSYSVTINPATLSLNPTSLPNGSVGTTYSQTITASGGTGGPYSYQASGNIPPGFAVITSTGNVQGAPTAAGTYTFTVTATDSASNVGSRSYTVTIDLSLSPASLPGGTAGTAYSQQITASGGSGSYTYTASSGTPPGVSLSSAGLLSGTPTSAGTYSFTATANDTAGHTGSRSYSLAIGAAATCGGVSFSIANTSRTEGYPLVFTITKAGSATINCSVNYATSDGTAFAGSNYTATSGTLTFTPSQSSLSVQVNTIRDYSYTKNLNMRLNLSSPSSGATLTNTSATGTIMNVDPNPCPTC